MRRVRDLHKGNMLLIGIGEVGVRLLANLIGFVVFAAIFGVVYGAFAVFGSTMAAVIVSILVGGTLFTLFAAFNIFIRMAYYNLPLPLGRRGREGRCHRAPRLGPMGVALGHSPTTGGVMAA